MRTPAFRNETRVDTLAGRKLPAVSKSADAARKSATDTEELTQPAAIPAAPEPVAPPVLTDSAPNMEEAPTKPLEAPVSRSEPEESGEPAPSPVTAAAKSPDHPREVAFATRIEPVQSTGHTVIPEEMASTAVVASAARKVLAANSEDSVMPTAIPTGERTAAPPPAAASTPVSRPTAAPAPVAETLPKVTTPLKELSLQLTQTGSERVDIRVTQQGSEVHVSVHSGDAILNTGLRQGLSELQSRLEENGYRSDMWRPSASAAPVAASPSAQASTNQSRGEDAPPQHSGSQQDSGRRNQNQSNQPRWVEELDSSLAGGETSSGGSHGFSS